MKENNLYKNTARYYDGGTNRKFSEDIGFYKKYVKPGMKILDIGCGTGRVSLELVKSEVNITAIDYSAPMLEIFKEKIKGLPANEQSRLKVINADMTKFNLNEKFDLILFPGMVFQALTSNSQRSKCLQRIKEHGAANATIIINMFNPNYKLLNDFPKLYKKDYEYFDDVLQVSVIRNTVGLRHDMKNKIIQSKYIFEISKQNGEKETIEDFLELGYMNKADADELFVSNGFEIINLYSWWDRSPYNALEKKGLIYILM